MIKSGTTEQKKIFIVEDHPLFRDMLAQVIEKELGMMVCGHADNVHDAMTLIEQTRPDAAIVDLTLRGTNGLELIKELKAHCISIPVLVLTMQPENIYAERALRAGAKGYISKRASLVEIVAAIRKVLDGQTYVSDRVTQQMLDRLVHAHKAADPSGIDVLSDREIEVFRLVGHGLNGRQISKQLRLDPSTVDSYRARIKQKLGIKNAPELYQRAAQWNASHG